MIAYDVARELRRWTVLPSEARTEALAQEVERLLGYWAEEEARHIGGFPDYSRVEEFYVLTRPPVR